MHALIPVWTLLPFALLVVGIAGLPLLLPHLWEKVWAQAGFAFCCAPTDSARIALV